MFVLRPLDQLNVVRLRDDFPRVPSVDADQSRPGDESLCLAHEPAGFLIYYSLVDVEVQEKSPAGHFFHVPEAVYLCSFAETGISCAPLPRLEARLHRLHLLDKVLLEQTWVMAKRVSEWWSLQF